jgi:hypothetical protein
MSTKSKKVVRTADIIENRAEALARLLFGARNSPSFKWDLGTILDFLGDEVDYLASELDMWAQASGDAAERRFARQTLRFIESRA